MARRHAAGPERSLYLRKQNAIGADRVIFGSDHPFGSIPVELVRVLKMLLPHSDLVAVLVGNALRLLGLGTLREGQRVRFELRPGRNGKFSAEDLSAAD